MTRKNVRTKIQVFLLVLFMLCGIAIPGQVQAAKEGNNDKTLVVGFDAEFPPYGYKDKSGEYVGFDLDLAEEVCKRRGWTLRKQPISWDSKDMELESDSIDCIWNGFTMNGREKEYSWSDPYIDNSQVVLVNKNSDIQKLTDLKGKIVVVQSDSSALAALSGKDAEEKNKELAKSFGQLQQVGDYNSAIMNLESGAVDAICIDMGIAKYQLSKHSDSLRMLEEKISTEQYAIGFKRTIRDDIQDTLDEMAADGTIQKIAQKYNLEDSLCISKGEQKDKSVGEQADNDGNQKMSEKQETGGAEEGNFFSRVWNVVKQLGGGFGATLLIFFLTLLFAMPLGLLVSFGRMSRFKIISVITKIYISIMRGTPLMLQLLVVFFGPYYLFGVQLASSYRFIAVIIGFTLNYAAYFAEIYRAGIENIPVGQREAAHILGYSRVQTFCKIIFPQMVKRVLPPVTNEIITLVKDTSLAFALAYTEMFTLAKQIAASQTNIMPLFVAGVFYYIFNYIVAFVMERIEKKMDYFK